MGGSDTGFTMNYDMTQKLGCNACSEIENKSKYWVASLYYHAQNGSSFKFLRMGELYYTRPDPTTYGTIVTPPTGLRMIAGGPFDRRYKDTIQIDARCFACLNCNGPGMLQTNGSPTTNCPNGLRA
ncbi:hypothetical protein N7457_008570 [Penicillium paradoxum]|uniref:uncharacterized protein n=1 Tax=Penicillium paradoxum TaxID=176176 RepID=UPI002548FCE7|nr:uncharacterized protein N7457_008570 [Penicillium paradoxum]KAJ5773674.1 hypothetical protein N7457_008570 [Penicillium paradoxum]